MIEKTLAELTLSITDGKHGDCRGKGNSGFYFISCKDVRDGQIHYEDARQIIEEDFLDAHKRTRLEPDDILVTNSGTIGRMAFIRDVPLTYRTTFQKSVAIVKPDKSKILPKYLYYQLQNCVDGFVNQSNGAAQKNLLLSTMRAFKMNIHEDEDIQMHIASTLSAYDDLIENNQKQIKLLEEAAQRLYKEWFVDLRFPGHETTPIIDGVPEGWSTVLLSDVASINAKSLPKNFEFDYIDYVDLGSVNCGHISGKTRYTMQEAPGRAKRQASNGDIIWGMVRPNLRSYALILHPKETDVFSTGFAILSAHSVPYSFLYCTVTTEAFVGYLVNCTNGAAYPAVKPEHFANAKILIPHQELLNRFDKYVCPLFDQIHCLQKQNENLTEARDRLLPKLMSIGFSFKTKAKGVKP